MTPESSVALKDLDINIENVVATASLDQKLDLIAIRKAFLNVEYRHKKFPGLVFRLKKPKTATLLFSTGKMVCTGGKSAEMVDVAVAKLHGILEEDELIY